jgi:Flp pilus assembly protein TadD
MRLGKNIALISLAALLAMGGCKPRDTPFTGKAINSITGMPVETEKRLSTSAANAIAAGKTDEALALYEKLYADNHRDPDIALNYAQLLRKSGQAEKASKILGPYVEADNGEVRRNAPPVMVNEYAANKIELGAFDSAETLLTSVIEDKRAADFHADAYNLMGVARDAQGQHKEAELDYQKALDGWKGDPTSIMNNLGLCLANQGMLDDALAMLRQALIRAPQKEEIAQNIQMVTELRKSIVPLPPTDLVKKKSKKKKK